MNPQEFIEKRIRKTTIDGNSVQIHLLPARQGLVLATKLSKVVLPSISALQSVNTDDGEDGGISILDIASVVVDNMDDINVLDLVEKLLEGVTVNGSGIDFDEYFMGNYGMLIKMVTYAFKENFSSFFTDGGMSLA